MDLIKRPYNAATSKPAQKTYLNTILFVSTSTVLLVVAISAYVLFYINYVPQTSIERVIHLQYGDGIHPYGVAKLDSSLVSQQAYDISISLSLPRSPRNVAAGNFMLSLSLLSPSYVPPEPVTSPPLSRETSLVPLVSPTPDDILYNSRRPAILKYESPLISYSSRLAALPLYVLGLRREAEKLDVPMVEGIVFPRGWKNVPGFVVVELQAGQDVQVYEVRVQFMARFEGMRWLMYNHRVLSLIVFTGAFWGAEVMFTLFAWLVLRWIFTSTSKATTPSPPPSKEVKKEEGGEAVKVKKEEETTATEPDMSDTPRNFPTYGRQQPLRFVPQVKNEGESEEYVLDETTIQPLAAEADDEEDGELSAAGGFRDSGVGTSFSDAGSNRGVPRRRSKGGRNNGI